MLHVQARIFSAGVRGPAVDLEVAADATVASVKAQIAGLVQHPVAAAPDAAALLLVASGSQRSRLADARTLAEQGVASGALLRLVSLRELAEDEAAAAATTKGAAEANAPLTATRRALADASLAAAAVLGSSEHMSTIGRRHAAAAAAAAAKALSEYAAAQPLQPPPPQQQQQQQQQAQMSQQSSQPQAVGTGGRTFIICGWVPT